MGAEYYSVIMVNENHEVLWDLVCVECGAKSKRKEAVGICPECGGMATASRYLDDSK